MHMGYRRTQADGPEAEQVLEWEGYVEPKPETGADWKDFMLIYLKDYCKIPGSGGTLIQPIDV